MSAVFREGGKKIICLVFPLLSQIGEASGAATASAKKNFIDQYFGVEYETTYPFLWAVKLTISVSVSWFCSFSCFLNSCLC